MHNPTVIYSIGYERRTGYELIEQLVARGVSTLVDVRQLPASRKPDFNRKRLSTLLEEAGISYVHYKAAGNPYRKESKNISVCLNLYCDYLDSNPDIVEHLEQIITTEKIAMLCYERDHNSCHRSILIDHIVEKYNDLVIERIE